MERAAVMKTALYYFTGTGNSLEAATVLSKQLDATMASMAAVKSPMPEFEKIILVFPVYMYRPPILVADFMRKLTPGPTVYLVAINGGDPGDVLPWSIKLLAENGVPAAGSFSVRLPDNYTPFGGPPSAEEQKEIFGGPIFRTFFKNLTSQRSTKR